MRRLAGRAGAALLRTNVHLVTAESCTGGLLAATCTANAGSSEWFEGAFVTYRIPVKIRVLDVSELTLARWGAVSEPTAREMAVGALNHCDAEMAVSITGVAGPGGGDVSVPVGMVWIAWAMRVPTGVRIVQTARHEFAGSREHIRRAAVGAALEGILAILHD